ncbi:NUDIX hydrolase [Patescibacteria group bacterium]|nr:NUDIX hydrolase [Patescibacteria group bacterium]MBU4368364.1 NUDIX hydrolase [Patescibacteria group bacterium]
MKKKLQKLDFPAQKAYFIASLVLVNDKGDILLTREKNNYDIWTVPGGEVDYKNKEQFLDAAIRETKEEIGIKIDKNKARLLDTRISYAEGDNPYKKYGIFILVETYAAKFPRGGKIILKRSQEALERKYDIKDYLWVNPSEITRKKLKVHKNFILTISKINEWVKKYERSSKTK